MHTVQFTTAGGEACSFELTYDPLPSELSGVFDVRYLPAWPAIVLPVEQPPTSPFLLACALFCGLISLVFFGLVAERNTLLGFLGRPGAWMIARMEELWDRLGIDHWKEFR